MPLPKRQFRPYDEARVFVRSLGLKTSQEYEAWSRSGKRPEDIPGSPRVYGSVFSWGDFLGNGGTRRRRLSKAGQFRPFEQAKEYVHRLGLQNQREYGVWSKTGDRPPDIPSNPVNAYGDAWTYWADYLGTERSFRPFEEARTFARSLGIKTRQEWSSQFDRQDFPKDLPQYPEHHYRDQGWRDWNDFLGSEGRWSRSRIRAFLIAIQPFLPHLRQAELYAILQRKRLLDTTSQHSCRSALEIVERLCAADTPEALVEEAIEALDPLSSAALNDPENPGKVEQNGVSPSSVEDAVEETNADVAEPELTGAALRRATELPRLKVFADLHAPDCLASAGLADEDVLEFLIQTRVSALWQEALEGNPTFSLERLREEPGGAYFATIRERFAEQHQGALGLPVPEGYSFTLDGALVPPNLMQRLTAFRLLRDRRLINASQTGAGKTLAAVNAAETVRARLTVVLAANATLDNWDRVIRSTYPGRIVQTKPREPVTVDPDQSTFLLYNYESFQQSWADALVRDLTARHRIDLVVLDELQLVRWRGGNEESLRRQNVQLLLDSAAAVNADLRVLGMSATPVINDLHEAKTLLELVTGDDLSELGTASSIHNAIHVHQLLTRHGLRYRVPFQRTLDTSYPTVDGGGILPLLESVRPRDLLGMEQAVLEAKLPVLRDIVQPGTVIFTPLVTGIVERLAQMVREVGLRPGLYTGDEKSGLDDFLEGKAQVLIGSEPISTGIDGLQRVADRLIFASLPWTSAGYEQIIGRLHRQGQTSERVEVFVPLVELRRGGRVWSWDRLKLDRIKFKRTLADAAVDGVIPEGTLPSPEAMQVDSLHALQDWIAQVGAEEQDLECRAIPSTDEVMVALSQESCEGEQSWAGELESFPMGVEDMLPEAEDW